MAGGGATWLDPDAMLAGYKQCIQPTDGITGITAKEHDDE